MPPSDLKLIWLSLVWSSLQIKDTPTFPSALGCNLGEAFASSWPKLHFSIEQAHTWPFPPIPLMNTETGSQKKNYILAVIFLPNIDLTNGDHKSVGHRQRLCRMVHFKPLHSQPIINFPTTDLLGSAKWTRFIIIPFEREKLRAGSFLDPRESFQGVFWVKKKPC